MKRLGSTVGMFAVSTLVLALASGQAQQFTGSTPQPMITAPVSETNLVRLPGSVRPEANAVNDRGIVPDTLPMEHMLLQLRRPPAQEQALKRLIDQQHDPASPNYHRWLTPEQFGTQFGPAPSESTRAAWRSIFPVPLAKSARPSIRKSTTSWLGARATSRT